MKQSDSLLKISLTGIQNHNRREIIFGAAAFLLGAMVVVQAWGFHQDFSYDGVGPRILPVCVGLGICASALGMILSALRGEQGEGLLPLACVPILLITAGVLFMYFFILRLGWIITATILFFLVSKAFKAEKMMASFAIGLALAVMTYALFNYALGVRLPSGRIFASVPGF